MKRAATKSPEHPPVDGTSEHQSLSKYIQARFDECSRSQKDVAQYIVDHLDEAAFQTAEELARRANTSSSTVVRFSQALGFEGFPELQAAAREEYRRVQRQGRRRRAPAPPAPLFSLDQNEFETALAADHLNVEETARKVSRELGRALIDAIVAAEKVLVAGTDQMAFFASYLRHLLMLLDLRVEVVASPSQEALSRLGRIDARDARDRALGRTPAPAGRARDEARAPPQGAAPPRSPTRPSRRSPSWPRSSSTTPPTAPPTCARTRRC